MCTCACTRLRFSSPSLSHSLVLSLILHSSPSVSPSLPLSLCFSDTYSLSHSLSLCLSVSLCHLITLSVLLYLSRPLCVILSMSLFLCFSFLSPSVPLSINTDNRRRGEGIAATVMPAPVQKRAARACTAQEELCHARETPLSFSLSLSIRR